MGWACAQISFASMIGERRRTALTLLRHRARHQPPGALPPCGGYVTDGASLFRVVSQFAFTGERLFASLENCLTLDVRDYTPHELREMALRPVRAAQVPATATTTAAQSASIPARDTVGGARA